MNLMEYRAMKAREAEQANSLPNAEEQPNVQAEPSAVNPAESAVQTEEQTNPVSTPEGANAEAPEVPSETKTDQLPEFIEIDGKQVSLDELRNGYLRQSDYTRKTQELSRQRGEVERAKELFEQIKANPEVAQQLNYDPQQVEMERIQSEYHGLLLEKEINELSSKYEDFEAREVLNLAHERGIVNLEDAYLLNKAMRGDTPKPVATQAQTQPTTNQAVDVEAIKAELKAQLLAEMKANVDTGTIISTNGGSAPTTPSTPQLTPAQQRVAKSMKMSDAEYAKWAGK